MNAFLHADWPAPAGVQALTTLRQGLGVSQPPFDQFNLGARCGDDAAAVAENRNQLDAALALPSSPRWLRQVHGVTVAIEPGFDEPEADAAVTRTPGTVLAILTADCLPVVFAARDARAQMAFLPTRQGHWLVDLPTLARQRLLDAGVTAVYGGELCTISEPVRFFSHRRDGRSGRIATLAWISP